MRKTDNNIEIYQVDSSTLLYNSGNKKHENNYNVVLFCIKYIFVYYMTHKFRHIYVRRYIFTTYTQHALNGKALIK